MKTVIVDLDDAMLEREDYETERDLQAAALEAIRRARRCGTDYVIWEDERVKCLHPDETGPYEQRALQNLERLNRRIAEFETLSPKALSLNDQPAK